MKQLVILFLLILLELNLKGQSINFNKGWSFTQGDIEKAELVNYNDDNWRVLNLPHDWSIEGDYSEVNPMGGQCGYLPAGIGWYRKVVEVPASWQGKYVEIAFDGVFMNSTVWANGVELGNRPYGWISFAYDISEIADTAKKIVFAVRVDNDKQPSARWYTGSGIYANTWIRVKDKLHIPNDGIFVQTKGNLVNVSSELKNKYSKRKKIKLKTSIVDANGTTVSESKSTYSIEEGILFVTSQEFEINEPKRWSPESPYLYTVISEVYQGKQMLDRKETRFGIRDVEWRPETGVWINGENIKLQGVCNHQDAGALGAAVPDKILRYRLQQLKGMGVNAFRTAHNPQTPQFYDMCDEMGILVMDEIFDGWHKKAANDYGAHSFNDWWKTDVTDWIKRDRNHPSIIIYSVGNETAGEVGRDLVQLCHSLDPTRPVTSGHSSSEFMDVFGVNGHSEKMGFFEELNHENRVFIGTENTHTWQVRGFYRTKTWYRDGYPNKRQQPYDYPDLTEEEVFSNDWIEPTGRKHYKQIFNSSYDNAMVRLNSRQNIEQLRDMPKYAGSFRWTGHDYIGEASYVHGGWPFKAFMGGAIDMANFEKDLYYLYQSQWTEEPMVHILPHWTHPTIEQGTEIPVWVYSNCDSVELFLNNRSLGKQIPGKSWDKMQCEWMVGYDPGLLEVFAYKEGKVVVTEALRTASAPTQLTLSIDGDKLSSKEQDIVQVRVSSCDKNGEFYPYGENRSYFHVIGPGKIKALDNGSPVDVEKHFEATNRKAFYGLTRAYVESNEAEGDITLFVASILGEKKLITSNTVSINAKFIALRGEGVEQSFDIYYTTDGSIPNQTSKAYLKPFDVELGTTVKAVVYLEGKPLEIMEERFAEDEGFVWTTEATAAVPGGDQAEDAAFAIANVSTQGKNFNGSGFLDFGRNSGGWVEWYQENDGSAGEYEFILRYSTSDWVRPEHKIQITINEKSHDVILPGHKNYRTQWHTYTFTARLESGANTIRVTALGDDGICIDELIVK